MLCREGYDDHLAGHVTARQPDGSLLVNPFGVRWDELRARDVVRIDLAGHALAGDYAVNPGVMLHLALHEARADVAWALHNHPRWGTIWADVRRAPPVYDQSGTYCGDVAVVTEYAGAVNDRDTARAVVAALGGADVALLANHGVLVLGPDVPQLLVRALALEHRARTAWHVETLGGGVTVAPDVARRFSDGLAIAGFPGLWESLVRRELRLDPAVVT
jgi:ribulose-5-phosphate 4-epimerase/fuculose-1-phosphate aldolase